MTCCHLVNIQAQALGRPFGPGRLKCALPTYVGVEIKRGLVNLDTAHVIHNPRPEIKLESAVLELTSRHSMHPFFEATTAVCYVRTLYAHQSTCNVPKLS
jgi:hypothetical protein